MGCGKQGIVRIGLGLAIVQSDPKAPKRPAPHPGSLLLGLPSPAELEKDSAAPFEMCECLSIGDRVTRRGSTREPSGLRGRSAERGLERLPDPLLLLEPQRHRESSDRARGLRPEPGGVFLGRCENGPAPRRLLRERRDLARRKDVAVGWRCGSDRRSVHLSRHLSRLPDFASPCAKSSRRPRGTP